MRCMRILAAVGTAVVVALFAASFSERADARSCYDIWAEAKGGSGSQGHYRHFVYVENDCEEWLQCTVWTDVDPQPPALMSVAPGATESAEINGHSQFDDPKAFGSCRFK